LPLTIEHFRCLETKEQNDLVAEQVMGWQLYGWEEECSQLTPGAEWQNGSDYYALKCTMWAPKALDTILEDDDMALLNWEETYGSRDWVTDIGAAMKLLEALANLTPAVYKSVPTDLLPWEWCCRVFKPNTTKAFCFNGADTFEGLPAAIVLTCLESLGVIDNTPLTNTSAVEELVLQAAAQGPAPGHNVDGRYCYERQTWIITETTHTLDGEDTDHWLVQYRNGHYVFQPV